MFLKVSYLYPLKSVIMFFSDTQDAKLNVDDTGIYLIGIRNSNNAQLIYYQSEGNPTSITTQINNITTFETTSPGTQPLPRKSL